MEPNDDGGLERAARALVSACLRVGDGERLVVVGDSDSEPVASAVEAAGIAEGAAVTVLRVDALRSHSTNHSGERPHKVLPDAVRRAMLSAQASVFVASAPHAESSMREQLLHVVSACGVRHAHMPGITARAFAAGVGASPDRLEEDAAILTGLVAGADEIVSESAEGTRLSVRVSKPWFARLAKASAGDALTLPAGSLIACPDGVSGTFAATASVGEFFGAREGLLRAPILFEIMGGVVVNVTAPGRDDDAGDLVRDIETLLHVAPGSDRVGLVVLGLSESSTGPIGDAAVDQHRPGLHLVFGDPSGRLTGATWTARTAFAACQARSTVRVDGATVVADGVLTLPRTSTPT